MRPSSFLLVFSSTLLAADPVQGFTLQSVRTRANVKTATTPTQLHYINDGSHDAADQEVQLESLLLTSQTTMEKTTDDDNNKTPISELKVGDKISGKVVKLLPFGALVQTSYDIPGKTPGCVLLHKDRSSSKSLKLNQIISNARVDMINRDTNSVLISTSKEQPTKRIPLGALKEGDEIQGRVRCVKEYGVFIDVGTKRDALLHSSQIMEGQSSLLKPGDVVTVQILNPWRSYVSPRNNRGITVRLV